MRGKEKLGDAEPRDAAGAGHERLFGGYGITALGSRGRANDDEFERGALGFVLDGTCTHGVQHCRGQQLQAWKTNSSGTKEKRALWKNPLGASAIHLGRLSIGRSPFVEALVGGSRADTTGSGGSRRYKDFE